MYDGIATKTLLADIARALGITPIPPVVLTAHKLAEVEKHPASWLYRHRSGIPLIAPIIFFSVALLLMTAGDASEEYLTMTIGATATLTFLGMGLIIGMTNNFTVRGPAKWHEKRYHSDALEILKQVPHDVAEMAKRILALVPDADVVIGELRQTNVILDPYLAICLNGEALILGIWDDAGIIYQATYD